MNMFIIQTFLLVMGAFLVGCFLGSFFRRVLGPNRDRAIDAPAEEATVKSNEPKVVEPPEPVAISMEAEEPVASVEPEIRDEAPVTEPSTKPAEETAHRDNLKRIKGIGKKIEAQLNEIGITTFEQVAVWGKEDIEKISDELAFKGRVERENWVGQARNFAKLSNTMVEPLQPEPIQDSADLETSSVEQPEIPGSKPSTLKKARQGGPDTLTLIEGIGPALEAKLFTLGVYHLSQIAKWDDENETWIGAQLGFPGRSQRENWVGEAKTLVKAGRVRSSDPTGKSRSQSGKSKIL